MEHVQTLPLTAFQHGFPCGLDLELLLIWADADEDERVISLYARTGGTYTSKNPLAEVSASTCTGEALMLFCLCNQTGRSFLHS